MDITSYYNKQFGSDLLSIMNAKVYSQEKISMTVFGHNKGGFRKGQRLFKNFTHKEEFLICYFFTTLLDQAMYTELNNEYYEFKKLTKYPKIVGLLSSSNNNMPPEQLLLLASYWSRDLQQFQVSLKVFTKYFYKDIENFFQNKLPIDIFQYRSLLKVMLVHLLDETMSENHWCLGDPLSAHTLVTYKDSICNITDHIKQNLDKNTNLIPTL